MRIHTVAYKDFRNLKDQATELGPGANILVGDNAQGKTSFLEAIFLCATGRSQRASHDKEMIRFGAEEAHSRVEMTKGQSSDRLDVHLRRSGKKGAALNMVPIARIGDLLGSLPSVVFSPEDLRLVKSGPAERRRFMDLELSQLDKVYCAQLQDYFRLLRQRNNALKGMRKRLDMKDTLSVWDSQLVAHGRRIALRRAAFVERLAPLAAELHARVSDGKERLAVSYKPNAEVDEYEEKMRNSLEKDILTGSTSVGAHKDDLLFSIDGEDARTYGSQGQQRTASLAAKLAEISLIREAKSVSPILLLDDVLSELDRKRQRYLLDSIQDVQSVITCAGIEDSLKALAGQAKLMRVREGAISEESPRWL
jgi:DNA replication and repair protein RecF